MPNWCLNSFEFIGNKESIYKLYHFIDDQQYLTFEQNPRHFNKNYWLGTFLERAGLDTEKFQCRGEISDWPDEPEPYDASGENYFLILKTETAWAPMIAMWLEIIKKVSPGVTLLYTAIECGNGLYQTNDSSYLDKYYVDVWINNPESLPQALTGTIFAENYIEYDDDKDYLHQELLKAFPDKSSLATSDLIKLFDELDIGDDNCIIIQPWEYVSEQDQY